MKIAGQTAQVSSLFDSTRDYCRKYLTEENADFSVTVTREDLAFEQEALRQEALAEGIKVRTFTDPFLERTAIQRKFAEFLFDKDVLMTHGSTVAVDGKAYLFTAKCGTGKSTHTRLWRQVFGDRAVMINVAAPGAASMVWTAIARCPCRGSAFWTGEKKTGLRKSHRRKHCPCFCIRATTLWIRRNMSGLKRW